MQISLQQICGVTVDGNVCDFGSCGGKASGSFCPSGTWKLWPTILSADLLQVMRWEGSS